MYESEQAVPLLNIRVVGNALVYVKGNILESVTHTGTGEYTIALTQELNFLEMTLWACLFGNPVAPD